jgi:drug/metabolite transporter (DMT)-like permease
MNIVLAVTAAVSSAVVLGASSVAEQRGARRVPGRGILSPRIMLDLVRQPVWAVGVGGSVAGFALQVLALRYGYLALVEPILACDLIVAVLISSCRRKRRDLVAIAGVAACSGGVAGFLVIARPADGQPDAGLRVLLVLACGLALLLAGCLVAVRHMHRYQSLVLALACGVSYGTSAFLVKLVMFEFQGGPPQLLGSWPLYALAVTGPLGFLLNQQAFARAVTIAPVLAIITTADPVISVVLAVLWLGDSLGEGTAQIAGEVVALALMSAGIALLARHFYHAGSATDVPSRHSQ